MQHCSPSTFQVNFPGLQPVLMKFESYNLQHCKINCRKLVFWVFSEQLLDHIIFWRLHFYFYFLLWTCLKSREKKLGRFESLMFVAELLTNSAVVCIVTLLCFEHAQQFHISHFLYHLRYYIINDYCWSC